MSLRKQVGQAVALYKSFREREPRRIAKVGFKVPKAAAVIGYVEGIDYRTTHGKKLTLYHHDFAAGSRPLLAVSSDGKQLLLLGGRYEFTERGIVDKDARGRDIENARHGKTVNPRHRSPDKFAKINKELEREADGYARHGYIIRFRALDNLYYISKDKAHIGTADSKAQAERVVDYLAGKVDSPDLPRKSNPSALRQKDVFAQIRAMGLTVKRDEAGEIRVTFKGVPAERAEAMAYYTDDLEDALNTATAMQKAALLGS